MNLRYHIQFGKAFRKIFCYIEGFVIYAIPDRYFRIQLNNLLYSIPRKEREYVESRADYYNKIGSGKTISGGVRVADFKYPFGQKHKFATYFFDLYKYVKYFHPLLRFCYMFGDVTMEPDIPAIVKSRPIALGSTNAVIMKLNQARHFVFVKDRTSFRQKQNMLVSRNIVSQPQRIKFLEMYCNHPMCDIGQVNKEIIRGHKEWIKKHLTISEQLKYKFICCIEGNDVATNLKWVMSSNSLAVMPRPRYESWFMEGKLIPDYHYVEIQPDYSDLIEKISYYIEHPEEAELIIQHCHEYICQFQNLHIEKLISLMVLQKYFQNTGQL